MTDIIVPTEQEGTKAVVKTWLKKVGDVVRIDDPVVELETDKVAVEIAATSAGTLSEILIEEGAEVEPGTVLGRVTTGATSSTEKAATQGASVAATEGGNTECQKRWAMSRPCRRASAKCSATTTWIRAMCR
ncbi:MAG: biotin/lipoyl-containing protein [Rhizomicrobium sp.]